MSIKELLQIKNHRPWTLPQGGWKYYQEWNDAIFLHWQVEEQELRKWVPDTLEIDLFEGKAWVSVVAFDMERIRPKVLPAFSPISNFHEINIRTYVNYKGKQGVYFLSIEGSKRLSCQMAKSLSALPYRYSVMKRKQGMYRSTNDPLEDRLHLDFEIGASVKQKSQLEWWLMERYALFQDSPGAINAYEIHHAPWPAKKVTLTSIELNYPRFSELFSGRPDLCHYSSGVQVLAWGNEKYLSENVALESNGN
ncbi:DUF2071 domain-containing protein [Echinicola strongylocentroti]|uniref:DUF2071 domain-containing protein n=1 Tax=Echinicola strongylocentroti TaxID=1795355 RepID=A0A2Z4IJ79_9BACT|nr:DUF2071 domain-containing protein [Echinicola strongylocentroti]AWW30750.1 DUF2071 domain-containing protein [Echinicola strongylocentroti]